MLTITPAEMHWSLFMTALVLRAEARRTTGAERARLYAQARAQLACSRRYAPAPQRKPLWAMSRAEFLTQPLNRWAELLVESVNAGRSKSWPAYNHARAWLQDWRGQYHTPEARKDALGQRGQGWVFAVEWSDRAWRLEIRRALERGEDVPTAERAEAGL